MAKEGRSSRMYGKGPKLERGEDGHMSVKKHVEKEKEAGADGSIREEGMPHHVRHAQERNDMRARHEHEHAMHDHGHEGSKEEMHDRHEAEIKAMHKRHEKELKAGSMGGEKSHKEKGEGEHKKEMKSEEKGDKILKAATKE